MTYLKPPKYSGFLRSHHEQVAHGFTDELNQRFWIDAQEEDDRCDKSERADGRPTDKLWSLHRRFLRNCCLIWLLAEECHDESKIIIEADDAVSNQRQDQPP